MAVLSWLAIASRMSVVGDGARLGRGGALTWMTASTTREPGEERR